MIIVTFFQYIVIDTNNEPLKAFHFPLPHESKAAFS